MNSIDFSFEVFPPKSEPAKLSFQKAIDKLLPLNPAFISVTYGAAGSTQTETFDAIDNLMQKTSIPIASHLTCVGASKAEINDVAKMLWDKGVKHIVALRGDIPTDPNFVHPHPDGYKYSLDLIKGLKSIADFEISAAAYPEVHQEAPSPDFDLEYLKRKIDAGADRLITQFFFDPEIFLRFRDKVAAQGIDAPLIPGLLPILNFKRMTSFAEKCGTSVPDFLHEMFDGTNHNDLNHKLLAMNILSHQITKLISEGVHTFHFYTLNEFILTQQLCKWLRTGF